MATITERLRSDQEAPVVDGQSFDVAYDVPLRELRHEAADAIDALVAALERAANEGQNGQLSLHTLMACGDALALARRKG